MARPGPGRDFPWDLVWCKLARQTTAFSTLGRGAVPAVLTNELHDMSTHRVPIQTLRPPRGAGPCDPQPPWSSSEEPIKLHGAGIFRACTQKPFAMQSSFDSRQVMLPILRSWIARTSLPGWELHYLATLPRKYSKNNSVQMRPTTNLIFLHFKRDTRYEEVTPFSALVSKGGSQEELLGSNPAKNISERCAKC